MNKELAKQYDPKDVEDRIYKMWLDGKYGNGGYWFTAIGIICGIYSGYKGSYQLIKDVWMKEEKQNGEIPKSNDE